MTAANPPPPGSTPNEVDAPAWPAATPAHAAGLLGPDDVHLWWLDLAAPPVPIEALEQVLDEGERQRAARFHFDVHRRRHIAAHGQMRVLLGAYLGLPPQAVAFELEERGKPRLAAAHASRAAHTADPSSPQLTFNLSHSADQGLLAVSLGATLGADIEVQHPLNDLEALARSHFTGAELLELHGLTEDRRHDGFFAAWTRKEAYVKALGAGLSVPLDSFEVALHPDRPAALRTIDGSTQGALAWTLWAARPTPGSWAALAVRTPGARVRTFSLRHFELP